MACEPGEHDFQPTQVQKNGKTITVQMCTKCTWIDSSSN
jgi:hypothetical protein